MHARRSRHIHRTLVGMIAWLIPVTLLVSLAACGSEADLVHRASPSLAPASCPVRPPPAAVGPTAGSLVPARPLGAVICQYWSGKGKIVEKVDFTAAAADGLAAVLDNAQPVIGRLPRCVSPYGSLPGSQLIRLWYAAGPRVSVLVSDYDCQIALVTVGHRRAELIPKTGDDLFGYTAITAAGHGAGPAAPNLIGLTAASAAARSRQSGYQFQLDTAAIDPRVPAGTVIFQSPPPGASAGGTTQVAVIIAVHPAPACQVSQVAGSYFGSQASAGNDVGSVALRDISSRPCQLPSSLRVTGLDSAGRPDTMSVRFPVVPPAVLTPDAPALDRIGTQPPGELIELVSIWAEYRDDPSSPNGLCTAHQIVPASWRIGLASGATIMVTNASAQPSGPALAPHGALTTCRGELGTPQPVTLAQFASRH